MAFATPLDSWLFSFRVVGRLLGRRGRFAASRVVQGEQKQLVRMETFAAWTIDALQEQMQPLVRSPQFAIALPHRDHQLYDHVFEHADIIRQLLGRRQRNLARGSGLSMMSSRAHADKTQRGRK